METQQQGSKPDGLFRAAIQAGGGDPGLRPLERHFVSLPTGSGKSLCYSLLPGVFDEIRCLQGVYTVIMVSPLVALMRDQARAMTERNIRAVYVGDAGDDATVDEICEGKFQLVLMYML